MANDENFPRDEAVVFLGDCYVRRSVLEKLHRLPSDQHFNVRSSFTGYTKYFKDHLKSKGNEHGLFVKVKFSGFTVLADIMAWAGHILILDFWIVETLVDSFLYQECVMFTLTEGKFEAFPDRTRRATAQIERDLLALQFHLAIEAAIHSGIVSRSTADAFGIDLNVAAKFCSRSNSVVISADERPVWPHSLTTTGNPDRNSRGSAMSLSSMINAQHLRGRSHLELMDCVLRDQAVAAWGRWLRIWTADMLNGKEQRTGRVALSFEQVGDIKVTADKTAVGFDNIFGVVVMTATQVVGTPVRPLHQTVRLLADALITVANVKGGTVATGSDLQGPAMMRGLQISGAVKGHTPARSTSLTIWSAAASEAGGFDYAHSSRSARLFNSNSELTEEGDVRFGHPDPMLDLGEGSVAATELVKRTGNGMINTLELL